jgi:ligand-binding sensor domain-containing protein/signal transduction histidine kinase
MTAALIFLTLFSFPARSAADVIPRLYVGKNLDGRLVLFRVGPSGNLCVRRQSVATGEWSPWRNLGGPIYPSVAVTTNSSGLIAAFAISRTNGAAQCIMQLATNGTSWSSWTNLGGNFEPVIAASQNADGRLEIFAVDPKTHSVRHCWQSTLLGPWSQWATLGTSTATDLLAAQNADGRVELFAVTEKNELMHCWQRNPNAGLGWSGWSNLSGHVAPPIAAAQNALGRLEIFGIDATSGSATRICQQGTSTSSNWTTWLPFNGTFQPGIAAGRSGDKRIEMFAVDKGTSNLFHRWEKFPDGSDAWSAWASLGQPIRGYPAVACDEEGDLEVFAVNSTNSRAVDHRRQISSASDWLDWASLDHPAFSYLARSWQISDGLPDNVVQAIAQTPDGFLWVGTRNGLAQFDGLQFRVLDSRNTPALKNSSITTVCVTSDGALWAGTAGGGVTRFQHGAATHYGRAEGLAGDDIHVIYEGTGGALWIGTSTGMSRYKGKTFVNYTKANGLSSAVINYFCQDREGNLWIATSGGLNRMKRDGTMNTFTMPNALPGNSVRAIYQDKGGRIWIGSNNGLLWYDQYWGNHFFAYSTKYGLSDQFVTAICEARSGNLWVGTYSGLNRFYGSKFYPQFDSDGQPFSKVNALCEDNEGQLWVGTQEGLICLARNYFTTYTQRQGLTHNNVTSVLQDSTGTMWIGTWGGGIDEMKGEEIKPALPTNSLSESLVLSLYEGRGGSIWAGADFDGGLTHLQDGKILRYTWHDGLPKARVQALAEDTNGNLWIGTAAGLAVLQDRKFRLYTKGNEIPQDDVRAITRDHQGQMWVGTMSGLEKFSGGKMTRFTESDGLPDDRIVSLYCDAADVLWIGTDGGGLIRQEKGRFTSFTSAHGLFSDVIFSILEDDKGWLWMSSPQAIFRARKSDLTDYDPEKSETISCISYGKADGLESPQCNGTGSPAAWKAEDGRLWFSTTKGLVAVDPRSVPVNPLPPEVSVEQIVSDRKPRLDSMHPAWASANPAPVTLPPGRGELEFRYTALNLSGPEKTLFRYRLDGINSDWVDAGTRRIADYENIPPGAYRFEVKACNKDGIWNDRGASLSFVLTPYYWQTWWFRAALGASLASILGVSFFYAARRRIRRKLELLEQQHAIEKERRRIAQDMHDQLGAGLTQISLLGEFARRHQVQNGGAASHVDRICDVTRELAQTVDEIVWAVNPRNDALNKLAVYLAAYAEDFFHATSIRCRLAIPAGLPAIPLAAEMRHNVFLVVKEAMNNVVKHAHASEARLQLALEQNTLLITVADDGEGFDLEKTDPSRNGLNNMRERLKEIGGTLEVSSAPGKGTRISLSVPLSSAKATHETSVK